MSRLLCGLALTLCAGQLACRGESSRPVEAQAEAPAVPSSVTVPALLSDSAEVAPDIVPSLEPEVQLRRSGLAQALGEVDAQVLRSDLRALFESCTDRERRLLTPSDWRAARESEVSLELVFPESVPMSTRARAELSVTHLLLGFRPADGGSELRVLARDGETFYSAFTKPEAALAEKLQARCASVRDAQR